MAHDTFWISKNESCEPYLRVNSANRFQLLFHNWHFWTATYRRCESGILIQQPSQLHPTDTQAQWPVYRAGVYGEDIVVSCTQRLVRYWLSKGFQPTICYRYPAKHMQSPSVTSPKIQGEPIIHLISLEVYRLREIHVCWMYRRIKLSSLRDASDDFEIPSFEQLLRTWINEHWGHKVSGLVLRYD
jgi:hypothetical protein